MLMKFKLIEERGIRPPLPPLSNASDEAFFAPPQAFHVLEDYERIVLSYRQRGEKIPPQTRIFFDLSQKHGLSVSTVAAYLARARRAVRERERKAASQPTKKTKK